MNIEDLAEYKERMMIAKEIGDIEGIKKYYKLFIDTYKELTGKEFNIK